MENLPTDNSAKSPICSVQPERFFLRTGSAAHTLLKILAAYGRLDATLYDECDGEVLQHLCKMGLVEAASESTADFDYETIYVPRTEEQLRLYRYKLLSKLPPLQTVLDLQGDMGTRMDGVWQDAIAYMSQEALLRREERFYAGMKTRTFERTCKNEFYKAFFTLTEDLFLAPDWAGPEGYRKDKKGDAKVDFFIPQGKWAFDVISEGQGLEKRGRTLPTHIKKWKQQKKVKFYRLLNFCHKLPDESYGAPFVRHIVFNADYSRCSVYDGKKRVLKADIQLELEDSSVPEEDTNASSGPGWATPRFVPE